MSEKVISITKEERYRAFRKQLQLTDYGPNTEIPMLELEQISSLTDIMLNTFDFMEELWGPKRRELHTVLSFAIEQAARVYQGELPKPEAYAFARFCLVLWGYQGLLSNHLFQPSIYMEVIVERYNAFLEQVFHVSGPAWLPDEQTPVITTILDAYPDVIHMMLSQVPANSVSLARRSGGFRYIAFPFSDYYYETREAAKLKQCRESIYQGAAQAVKGYFPMQPQNILNLVHIIENTLSPWIARALDEKQILDVYATYRRECKTFLALLTQIKLDINYLLIPLEDCKEEQLPLSDRLAAYMEEVLHPQTMPEREEMLRRLESYQTDTDRTESITKERARVWEISLSVLDNLIHDLMTVNHSL